MSIWQLTRYDERYAIGVNAVTPCVLLSGWGMGSDIFEWLLPGLAQHFVVDRADHTALPDTATMDTVVDALAQQIEQPAWIIGWSLGGNIALALAARHPDKVLGLCLQATNPSFVAREHWPQAMPQRTFSQFQQGLAVNAAKTLKRFDLLQSQGDAEQENLRKALKDYRSQQVSWSDEQLHNGLCLLADCDQADLLSTISVPALWCFGGQDALVDVAVADTIREHMPQADIQIMPDAAHLPFLTHTDGFFTALLALFEKQQDLREKQKVASSFSKAAASYDSSARLQQWVAGHMFEGLQTQPELLVDVGCGTAYWTTQLADKAERVIAFDMAEGMLRYGQSHYDNVDHWVAGDLESMPFADNTVDMFFSSLAVQWCGDLTACLQEWHRVLKPGGRVMLSTLGPKTLFELGESWRSADQYQHVNQFQPADTVYEQINASPFLLKELKVEKKIVRYQTLKALMKDLKNIGAQTVLQGGVRGLMGKQRFQRAEAAYEKYRDHLQLLPATYEVIFVVLQKESV